MKSEDETEDALQRIERKVESIASDNPLSQLEPRLNPAPGSPRYQLLEYVRDAGPVTATDAEEVSDINVTREFTELFRAFALDREKNSYGNYEYEITVLGERVLDSEQTSLDDPVCESEPDPWEGRPINESQYWAIQIIDDISDAPRSAEINELFVERAPVTHEKGHGSVVTPYLTQIHRDGYVERTPTEPYRYWLTEKGKEVLGD